MFYFVGQFRPAVELSQGVFSLGNIVKDLSWRFRDIALAFTDESNYSNWFSSVAALLPNFVAESAFRPKT